MEINEYQSIDQIDEYVYNLLDRYSPFPELQSIWLKSISKSTSNFPFYCISMIDEDEMYLFAYYSILPVSFFSEDEQYQNLNSDEKILFCSAPLSMMPGFFVKEGHYQLISDMLKLAENYAKKMGIHYIEYCNLLSISKDIETFYYSNGYLKLKIDGNMMLLTTKANTLQEQIMLRTRNVRSNLYKFQRKFKSIGYTFEVTNSDLNVLHKVVELHKHSSSIRGIPYYLQDEMIEMFMNNKNVYFINTVLNSEIVASLMVLIVGNVASIKFYSYRCEIPFDHKVFQNSCLKCIEFLIEKNIKTMYWGMDKWSGITKHQIGCKPIEMTRELKKI